MISPAPQTRYEVYRQIEGMLPSEDVRAPEVIAADALAGYQGFFFDRVAKQLRQDPASRFKRFLFNSAGKLAKRLGRNPSWLQAGLEPVAQRLGLDAGALRQQLLWERSILETEPNVADMMAMTSVYDVTRFDIAGASPSAVRFKHEPLNQGRVVLQIYHPL